MIARLQQRKAEKERREKELLENETKRAQEIYVSLRKVREAIKKKELDEMKKEDEAWRQQEMKAQEEERRRRSSVSLARREVQREREEAKRLSMVEGPRRSFSVKPQRPPPPVPSRSVDNGSHFTATCKIPDSLPKISLHFFFCLKRTSPHRKVKKKKNFHSDLTPLF